jgi:Tol biopolymer transport system component
MNADGSGDAAVPSDSAFDSWPVVSPDGKLVAFSRATERGQPGQLFVIGLDGSGIRQLTNSSASREVPSWLPDGRFIAFQANLGQGQGTEIAVVDVLTGEERHVTHNGPGVNDETLSWFPDGRRLAIQSDRWWHLERL